jgi:ATP-dependent RNA helicase RhlE
VIRALIVTPTRELAIQIDESFKDYGQNLKLQSAGICGGVTQTSQVNRLKAGVDILIATPGRLLDLVQQRHINLRNLEIFVLDEADRMLDMGFIHDVKKIIKIIPEKRQTLFFSATMPKEITSLANSILTNPSHVEVTPVSSTAETIQQEMYFVDTENKKDLLIEVLNSNKVETALVFTRTKHGADKLVKILNRNQIKSEAIHGNKSQNARQNALNNFKNKTLRVLVATDIAARGIDIDQLEFVVNYDIPNIPETYVHRIGRTGRAGASGKAVSFCNTEEQAYVKDIQKLIGLSIPVVSNHAFPASGKITIKQEQKPRFKKPKPTSQQRRKQSNHSEKRRVES